MSLLSVVPRPTPVELGDQTYLASELRLADLADLEAYVRIHRPHPFDVAAPYLNSLQPHSLAFRQLLIDTMEKVDDYTTDLNSPEAAEIRNTEEGVIYFVWVVLRREHPQLTLDQVAKLLRSTTFEQLSRLSRVAWAPDPMGKLIAFIEPPKGDDGTEQDWAMAFHVYATKCTNGPAFDQLTLSQFTAFMCQGELPKANVMSGPVETFDWDRKNRITNYFKDITDEQPRRDD